MVRVFTRACFLLCVLLPTARLNAQSSTPGVLVNFSAEAGFPQASLVAGPDGNLYGTTLNGGQFGLGSVYRIAPNGSGFETLHSFNGPDGTSPFAELTLASDGYFYGTTQTFGQIPGGSPAGTIFRFTTNSDIETVHAFDGQSPTDGAFPSAALVESGGFLYGTTSNGGQFGPGTIFRLDTTALPATVVVLHSFESSDAIGSWSRRAPTCTES